jgi:hypothetical protein
LLGSVTLGSLHQIDDDLYLVTAKPRRSRHAVGVRVDCELIGHDPECRRYGL